MLSSLFNALDLFYIYICDVVLMIDCDVAEKKNENKVGMSSYNTKLHTLATDPIIQYRIQ